MKRIPYGEFGPRFLQVAVTAARVADIVAEVAGGAVEVGPIAAGPGGVARVWARGDIGTPSVETEADAEPLRFRASLPIALDLRVKVAGLAHSYRCEVEVLLVLVLGTGLPLTLIFDIEPVYSSDVVVSVHASGGRARLLRHLGGLDGQVRRHVAEVVNERVGGEAANRARMIELTALIDRAWSSRSR